MTRAQGVDLSHWQSDPTFASAIKGKDFVGIKCVDGTSGDPEFNDSDDKRWTTLGNKVADGSLVVRIAYLFLELGISGAAQVDALLAKMGTPSGSKRAALDWEASALASPGLLGSAGRHLWDKTKVPFLVYCSDANVPAAASALSNEGMKAGTHFFWWIARYGALPEHSWTFWQDVGIGLDHDQFYDDRAALEAWAGREEDDDMAEANDMAKGIKNGFDQYNSNTGDTPGRPNKSDDAYGWAGYMVGAMARAWADAGKPTPFGTAVPKP